MADELQKHLDKGLYGAPLLNPEEQRKYMGTFRERCYLSMTLTQMKDKANKEALQKELAANPDAQVLMNGKLPESLQTDYIQLLTKAGAKFTIVNDFVSSAPDGLGLLVVAKEAVNEPVIDVAKKYPATSNKIPEPPKRPGFFEKLFH